MSEHTIKVRYPFLTTSNSRNRYITIVFHQYDLGVENAFWSLYRCRSIPILHYLVLLIHPGVPTGASHHCIITGRIGSRPEERGIVHNAFSCSCMFIHIHDPFSRRHRACSGLQTCGCACEKTYIKSATHARSISMFYQCFDFKLLFCSAVPSVHSFMGER